MEGNQNLQNQNDGSKEATKIEKNYNDSLTNLISIIGGKDNLKTQKLDNSEAASAMQELFKEEREAAEKEFKIEVKNLIRLHSEFEKIEKEERRKLEKLILDKKKEFVNACQKTFNKVKDIQELSKSYTESLEEVLKASVEEKVQLSEELLKSNKAEE